MKSSSLTFICTFAIITIALQSIGVQSADAQERMFGNGRFLKRVFSDLAPQPKPPKQPTPTPAAKKGQLQPKQPTAARRPSQNSQPTLADQSVRPRSTSQRSIQPARSDVNRESINRLPKSTVDAGNLPTRSNAKSTLGFGMLVKLRNDKLYVDTIDPSGNAASAGVRVGDRLVAGGGIEFESLSDYNGIGDILEDGDQLEFELERDGREKEMLIVYGKASEDQVTMMEGSLGNKATPETPERRAFEAPKVNQITTQDNNSFMPTTQNVKVQQRNPAFSSYQQQTTHRAGSSETIRSMQGGTAPAPSLQLPATAESVLH